MTGRQFTLTKEREHANTPYLDPPSLTHIQSVGRVVDAFPDKSSIQQLEAWRTGAGPLDSQPYFGHEVAVVVGQVEGLPPFLVRTLEALSTGKAEGGFEQGGWHGHKVILADSAHG